MAVKVFTYEIAAKM